VYPVGVPVSRVGMNFGHAIASIAISNLFDKENDGAGNPLRPGKRGAGARSGKPQRDSNSFAAHPERW
jgi:hypothetical protein